MEPESEHVDLQKEEHTLTMNPITTEQPETFKPSNVPAIRPHNMEIAKLTSEPANIPIEEGTNDEVGLLRLENNRLKSQQKLANDATKEVEALYKDRATKEKKIKDLNDKVKSLSKDTQASKLLVKQLNAKVRSLELNLLKANADDKKSRQESMNLSKQVKEQAVELTKIRADNEQQKGHKRKLTTFLKDMGVTKDDFEDEAEPARPAMMLNSRMPPTIRKRLVMAKVTAKKIVDTDQAGSTTSQESGARR